MNRPGTRRMIALMLGTICLFTIAGAHSADSLPSKTTSGPQSTYFTKNMGQWPDSILFRCAANGEVMWFTKDGIFHQFFRRVKKLVDSGAYARSNINGTAILPSKFDHEQDRVESFMIKAEFVGASNDVEVTGLNEQEYKCNYFIGDDKAKWRTVVPNFAALKMRGIFLGTDAVFECDNGRMKLSFEGEPVSEQKILVKYAGSELTMPADSIATIQATLGKVGFPTFVPDPDVLPVDLSTSRIDPATANIVYSSYLGGALGDIGDDIAVDNAGCAYVTGLTFSSDFPTQSGYQLDQGVTDVFVSKISASGGSLIFSTYLGGSDYESGEGIAIDTSGNVYITGYSRSTNYPSQTPFSLNKNFEDVILTKLSPSGNSLVYSTYLGGDGEDYGYDIAVDNSGCAYITGHTVSSNFPTQNPYQTFVLGSAFVTKFSATGTSLIYSTYLGGANVGGATGYGIAVDASQCAYVTGSTGSTDFPTVSPIMTDRPFDDGFVTKLSSAGNTLVYSTYLGGNNVDYSYAIAVDNSGSAFVTGVTYSPDFPTQSPFQTGAGHDAFVAKISPLGNSLVYSTYLGGDDTEIGWGIAVTGLGNAVVTGATRSTNFPTKFPFQEDPDNNYDDVFLTVFSPSGSSLEYSTYIGGNRSEAGKAVALDTGGNVYLTGWTQSTNFPERLPLQTNPDFYTNDAFVTKLTLFDGDNDGYPDMFDNCSSIPNSDQIDTDGDQLGDACDTDDDNDGILDTGDNCPTTANLGQQDSNNDGIGDACCCVGTTGNVDCDAGNGTDIADLSALIDYLYITFFPLCCSAEANTDGQTGIDISDLSALIDYLYISFTPPAACQ